MIDRNETIKIVPGTQYRNRAWQYLAPAMKVYGDEVKTKLNNLMFLAVGIQDFGFNKSKEAREYRDEIYFLFDVNGRMKYNNYIDLAKSRTQFHFLLSWFKEQPYYVRDYSFDSGRSGHQHMIVFRLPYEGVMKRFLEGDYTNLYPDNEKVINRIILDNGIEKYNPAYGAVTKDMAYHKEYVENLNKLFGTYLSEEDTKHHKQFDIPPLPKNEVFRWHD